MRLTLLGLLLTVLGVPLQGWSQETGVLEAPVDVGVCQAAYGGSEPEALGTLLVSWSNPEMYEVVEFSVDENIFSDVLVGEGDGADGVGTVTATVGTHVFGIRGIVGERVSDWSTAEFEVLEESPLPEPITELDCEFLPIMGGMLRLTWQLGPDAWTAGRLQFPDAGVGVDIEAGVTSIDVLTPEPITLITADTLELTDLVTLAFKNEAGYLSPSLTPVCTRRTPQLRRGDCNFDAIVNISDSIFLLNDLFPDNGFGRRGPCDDACDANDDGALNVSDSIYTLNFLFTGGASPPAPGPSSCGVDESDDFLGGICTCE